jgi:hypothetical protein
MSTDALVCRSVKPYLQFSPATLLYIHGLIMHHGTDSAKNKFDPCKLHSVAPTCVNCVCCTCAVSELCCYTVSTALHSCEADRKPRLRVEFLLLLLLLLCLQGEYRLILLVSYYKNGRIVRMLEH